ncbi:MAG: S1C family serine protease [candidate division WOR-3 bacterium]
MKKITLTLIFINLLNSQNLKKIEDEIIEFYKKVSPSIFELKFKNLWSTGFSFEKNRIITILPEVEEGENIYFYDIEGKEYKGEIEGWDESTHIALIKTEENLKVPEFSKFEHNFPKLLISFSIKGKGNFLLLTVYDEKKGKIFIEGNVPPSFSGAPILNTEGKIVGILRGKRVSFEIFESIDIEELKEKHPFILYPESKLSEFPYKTIGYTYDHILKRVNLIKEKGKIYEGFLGVLIDYKEKEGIYIKRILKDSPAEKAGLNEGDIILSYAGNEYKDLKDFVDDVKNTTPGSEVKMEIKRNDEIKTVKVKIGKREKGYKIKLKEKLKDLFKDWFEE